MCIDQRTVQQMAATENQLLVLAAPMAISWVDTWSGEVDKVRGVYESISTGLKGKDEM